MRCASDTSRKWAPSPSKLQGAARLLDHRKTRLVGTVEDLAAGAARRRRLVGQFDGGVAVPLDAHDLDGLVRRHAPHDGPRSQAFQSRHPLCTFPARTQSGQTRCHAGAFTGGQPGAAQAAGKAVAGVVSSLAAAPRAIVEVGVPQQARHVQRPRLLLDRPGGGALAESVGVPVRTRVASAGATRRRIARLGVRAETARMSHNGTMIALSSNPG